MRVITTLMTITAFFMFSFFGPVDVSAEKAHAITKAETKKKTTKSTKADVRKFDLHGHSLLDDYNAVYQAKVKSITTNGGNYSGSPIENAIDGDFNTHWETAKPNNASHTNEVELVLEKAETLNRIVYAARQSAGGKGFAREFEIYGSTEETGDNYTLVSTGAYGGSNGDVVEIQFKPTKLKRVKFVFNKAAQDWASASEFQFYKEDPVSDKMRKLFTDDTFSEVSKEFASEKKLNELEKEAKDHPLYSTFKEEIEDAQAILSDKGIKPMTAETIPFAYYPNEKYSDAFQMSYDNIKSIRNNAGHYGQAKIDHAIDRDITTYWETNTGNSKDFTNEVEIEFKKAATLNRLVFGARSSDNKGFAEQYEIYVSKTSKGDTYQKLATGKHETVGGLVEAKFKPTTFKRVKFRFIKSSQNWATLSEIAFYKEDPIGDRTHNLFTDGLMNELNPEFASKKKIDELEKDIKGHPIEKELQEKIDIAKSILNNEGNKKQAIVTASQRGDAWATAGVKQIPRTSFSLDTFGRYVTPGETLRVFVDADPNGIMPKLVFGQIANDKGGWIRRYPLKPGMNTITAPPFEQMNPAIIYVENSALPSDQAYAPRVRLEGGTDFPLYDHGKTDPAQFRKELEAYVKKISVDDNDFANGKPKDLVYNVAELVSENNTISTSAAGALKGLQEIDSLGKDASDTMDEWEIMWEEFQKISGNVKDDPNPKQQYFPAKFTSRVFTKGPYGWSAGGYTGYNGGDTPRRDSGFFKIIAKPISAPGNDDWAYFHEWGHNINNHQIEHLEVTNNIYAVLLRETILNNYDDRADWTNLYKRFQGEKVNHGYFTHLGILLQLEYYYEGSYGLASRVARDNPEGVLSDLDNSLQKMVVAYSLGLGKDLTTFFDEWGYVKATDKMKKKVAHLPEPDVKLEYMHSSGRNYDGKGFTKNSKLDINALKTNEEKKETTISYSVDQASADAAMGYEIIRDGKVIGYTTSTTFVDKDIDPNKAYVYEVVAYDKLLKPLDPLEVQSKQPTLSVEEFVTLKLHQDFDPKNDAKAISYTGKDLTKNISIKSNNVDVTKKGSYQIVYEIKDEGTTVSKTSKVTVTSDYTYLSDLKETSFNIAWGGLKKDLAPSGNAITLIRQGLDATYAKGLGVHANSEVIYDTAEGQFDYFESYIGIDQAVKGQNSSATFEVWVDDQKKYSSKVFNANTEHEFVRVPITGAKKVKLITTDAKMGGNTADHTVWASAKFTKDSSAPILTIPEDVATKVGQSIDLDQPYKAVDPEDGDITDAVKVKGIDKVDFDKVGKYTVIYSVTDSDGHKTTEKRIVSVVDMDDFAYLSDYDWSKTENSYTAPNKDKSISGNALRLTDKDGKEVQYAKGFGAHSNSTIFYDLTDLNVAYITSFVGVDRQMYNTAGSVEFKVYADGEKKFDSGLMNSTTPQKYFEIDVSGVSELKLVVTDGGNGNGSDHATWGDTKIYFAGESHIITDVDPVDTNSETVTGITKPNTVVEVRNKEGKILGEAQVDKNGEFEVKIPNQVANTSLTIIVKDQDDKQLDQVTVKVEQAKLNATELESLIKKAKELLEDDYTTSTFESLKNAIDEAEDVLTNAKVQKELDKAVEQLQAAIDKLEKVEPEPELDTEALEKLIEQAKAYKQEQYTEASFNKLQTAIDKAEEVLTDATAQKELDEAVKQLQASIDSLEKVEVKPEPEPEPELDTRALEKLIEHAKVYEQERYTEASFDQLQTAIGKAEDALTNATTQKELDEAAKQLQAAIDGLEKVEAKPEPEPEPKPELDPTELEKLIEHAKVYEQERYTEVSFNQLQTAIGKAEDALTNATAQKELDEAVKQLQTAIAGLEKVEVEPEPEPDLDTTELEKLIAHAKVYEQEHYTESTFNQLQEQIKHAESVLNSATRQAEVEQAITTLKAAIQGLEKIPTPDPEPALDTTELEKLITHAKLYEKAAYTEVTFNQLQQVMTEAEQVVNQATSQQEIEDMIAKLKQAIQALEPIIDPNPGEEIDTTKLAELIAHAKGYEAKDYTASSFATLQNAINASESVVNNATTQEEVEASIKQLQEALLGLEKVQATPEPEPEINTDELRKLIALAKEYQAEAYTESSYANLQTAIGTSESVVNNATTQEEVEAAVKQLREALLALEEKPTPESKPEIDTDELRQLIAHAKEYQAEAYTESSYANLQAAIGASESVVNNATTQEEVERSIEQLREALLGLEVKPDLEPKPEIDTDELAKLIAHAKKYDEADYTENSFAVLKNAIKDAELVLNNVTTQEEVELAIQQLKAAIGGLELRPKPSPEPDPEPSPDPNPEPSPEPDPEPSPDPNPEPSPDPNPEPSPEPDPEPSPDPNPEPNPEPTPEPNPEPSPELSPESTPELQPDTELGPNVRPEFENQSNSDKKSDVVETPGSETNKLPSTATQTYNVALFGLLLAGLASMFLIRRRKVSKD